MISIWHYREPTLEDMLSDSVIRAVMRADGVDPQELRTTLQQVSRNFRLVGSNDEWIDWPATGPDDE
jgi:hypothetical protein